MQCAVACEAFQADLVAPKDYAGNGHVLVRSPASITLGAGRLSAVKRWLWARSRQSFSEHLVYSPTHHGMPREIGQIITIHDLIALRFPRQHPTQYLFFRHQMPKQLRGCRAVFTVSETSRSDIHDYYQYPLDRIFVVPNGVDRTVFQPPAADVGREPFLLIVGAAYPHKNVEEVLENAAAWSARFKLVIASCRGAYRTRLDRRVAELKLSHRVQFLDYVSLPDLVRLYQTCSAFLYPSKWEGFGVPPLEALACGAPVIASDIPAHREVLRDSAVFVPLGDSSAWHAALGAIGGPETRHVPRSHAALDEYSWQGSARALVRNLSAVEPSLCLAG